MLKRLSRLLPSVKVLNNLKQHSLKNKRFKQQIAATQQANAQKAQQDAAIKAAKDACYC